MTGLSGHTLVRQAAWAFNGQVLQGVFGVASVLALGRILGPEAYGLYAIAMLVAGFAEIVVGGHMSDYLVQKEGASRGDENAAFLLVAGVTAVFAVVLLAFSGPIAGLAGSADAGPLMPAVAAILAATALGTVPVNLLVRDMRFDTLARIDGATAVAAFAAGLGLALAGAGVWSLVLMELLRRALRSLLACLAAGWMPGVATTGRQLSDFWSFARSRLAGSAFAYVGKATPRLVIASMLGVEALGFFAVANRLIEQVNGLITGPLSAVAFPATARARGDLDRLRAYLARAIALSTAVAWPIVLGFVVVAPVAVPYALGPRWEGAVATVQILALIALRAPVTGFNTSIVLGMGRADLKMLIQLQNALLALLLCPIGAVVGGLEGVAVAMLVRSLAGWPLSAAFVARLVGFPFGRQVRTAAVASLPAVVMAVATEALRWAISGQWPPLVELAVLAGFGSGLYVVLWAAANRSDAAALAGILSRRIGRRSP